MTSEKKTFYVKVMGDVQGPMTGKQVKQLAMTGKLFSDSHIKQGADGNWVTADRIKGISFDNKKTVTTPSKGTSSRESAESRKREVVKRNGGNSAKSILMMGAFFAIASMLTLIFYYTGYLEAYAPPSQREWLNSRGFVPTTIIVFIAGCISLAAGVVARRGESGDNRSQIGKLASLEFSKKNVFIGFGIFWLLLIVGLVLSGLMKG